VHRQRSVVRKFEPQSSSPATGSSPRTRSCQC
jgi:hypothetical protein